MFSRNGKLLVVGAMVALLFLGAGLLLPTLAQGPVTINEVAWAGTNASGSDEYIELAGPPGLDLTGWRLEAVDGTPGVTLTGVISSTGYYLLERTNEETVASLPASQLYTGALSDDGEYLRLLDAVGGLVDEIDAPADWPAGDSSPQRAAMEKFGHEFLTNDCNHTSGATDADGDPICGTPGAANQEPQPVSMVRFTTISETLVLSDSVQFVARAWNSQGTGPEGSTMEFAIVSTSTEVVAIAPLTATMSASGTATLTVTSLQTGTAILKAQWFGTSGGVAVDVVEPPPPPPPDDDEDDGEEEEEDNTATVYLPLIIK